MNSDHAPTAEEQLPPLDEKYVEMTEDLGTEDGDSDVMVRLALDCRTRQLLAALRENREKDARIAELESIVTQIPLLDQLLDKRAAEIERLRAKLRAVSDAIEGKLEGPLGARIRAIVEGK